MRRCVLGLVAALTFAGWSAAPAFAQGAGGLRIEWEVKNRFRLFRSEADFERHVAAYRSDGVLGAERRLARESDGRGWARDMVERLCVDRAGRLMDVCERDGVRESYLAPRDHPIGAVLSGPLPAGLSCVWSFEDGGGEQRQATIPCDEEVKLRVLYGKPAVASVEVVLPDGTAQRVVARHAGAELMIVGTRDDTRRGSGGYGSTGA